MDTHTPDQAICIFKVLMAMLITILQPQNLHCLLFNNSTLFQLFSLYTACMIVIIDCCPSQSVAINVIQ